MPREIRVNSHGQHGAERRLLEARFVRCLQINRGVEAVRSRAVGTTTPRKPRLPRPLMSRPRDEPATTVAAVQGASTRLGALWSGVKANRVDDGPRRYLGPSMRKRLMGLLLTAIALHKVKKVAFFTGAAYGITNFATVTALPIAFAIGAGMAAPRNGMLPCKSAGDAET